MYLVFGLNYTRGSPWFLNQDLQDFQNYIGRRRFEREG